MGGHERGEVASREVAAALERGIPVGTPTTTEAVVTTIVAANAVIRSIPTPNGVIGTTVAGLALVALSPQTDLHWMVFNVGDSRVYTWTDGVLRRITVDHSAVQELIDAGSLTEAEAREHPDRNIVTKAIGVEAGIDGNGSCCAPTGSPVSSPTRASPRSCRRASRVPQTASWSSRWPPADATT
jgi:serine/threonine protein phosphatase PrpC